MTFLRGRKVRRLSLVLSLTTHPGQISQNPVNPETLRLGRTRELLTRSLKLPLPALRTGRMMLSNSVLRPIPIGLKRAIATGLQQGSM